MHLTQPPKPFDPSKDIWLFVSEIVFKALEKHPDDRFQSAGAFRAAVLGAAERIRKADKQTWVADGEDSGSAAPKLL